MSKLDTLQELLTKLPGIGPRQARRFAYFFMQTNQSYVNELVSTINDLRQEKYHCKECNRIYFTGSTRHQIDICPTCSDETRDLSQVLLVAKQADYENVERAGVWNGRYFVLNSLARLSDKNPAERLPLELLSNALSGFELSEFVIGLPLNPEGQYTKDIILEHFSEFIKTSKITVSELGRGLSTGSELEYSDPDTLKEALSNRH